MIFFIIDKDKRTLGNFSTITTSAPSNRQKVNKQNMILISWNEVVPYNEFSKLEQAVITEAKIDPMCLDMRKNALAQYGIDPFLENYGNGNLNQTTMKAIRDKVFMQWAHPMIGNIGVSPYVRPEIFHYQYLENWDNCSFIDDTTKQKIKDLFQTLPPMDRSARDQVRICYNITELARSIIGEITSNTSRRLDKIFALNLCKSANLKTNQLLLVKKIIPRLGQELKSGFVRVHGFEKSEYLKYYMPDTLKPEMKVRSYAPQWYLYEQLIKIATDGWYQVSSTYQPIPLAQKIIAAYIEDWKKIPDPIRLAILINSFRRFVKVTRNNNQYSMGLVRTKRLKNKKFKSPYKIIVAASKEHVPEISFNSFDRSFTWSWNRDEYHLSTKTYRHFLMNLWGGPSGHARGNVQFILNQLGMSDLTKDGPIRIITGLYAFWRLYYDKRVSGVHTLAESMESSITFSGYDQNSKTQYTINQIPAVQSADAYQIIVECLKAGKNATKYRYVDPIKVMQTIRKKYYKSTLTHQAAYEDLQIQIDTLRKELTDADYSVPQWSKAISKKQGMRVISFSDRDSNAKSALSDTLFIRAMFNKVHSNIIDRALKEQ